MAASTVVTPPATSPALIVSPAPLLAAALPSASSALAFVQGQPGSFAPIVMHTAGRAALIGLGLFVAGERRHVLRNAVAGALAIETFVLLWANHQVNQAKVVGT